MKKFYLINGFPVIEETEIDKNNNIISISNKKPDGYEYISENEYNKSLIEFEEIKKISNQNNNIIMNQYKNERRQRISQILGLTELQIQSITELV